jgi:hypothetical protein
MSHPPPEGPRHAQPGRRTRPLKVIGFVLLCLAAAYGVGRFFWPDTPPVIPPPPHCQATVFGDTATIDIEQSENASLIGGVVAQRRLVPRALSIALATAFQESKIRNLDYGDRDSLGLFQQRPSMGWGTEEQIMDPIYSTHTFLDAMVLVPGWADMDIGDVAQEVQRSGFPDAYDQHVARARVLASALSGETTAAWSCIIRDGAPANPTGLADGLQLAYGDTVTVAVVAADPADPAANPARLTLTAADPAVAWSAAAYAQSWATARGVASVQVDDQLWTADDMSLAPWVAQTEGAVGATTVVVTFTAP